MRKRMLVAAFVAVLVSAGALTLVEPALPAAAGSIWAIEATPTPGGAAQLTGSSCVSATNCAAVGWSGIATQSAITARWNGASWASAPISLPAHSSLSQLSAVSCTSDCVAAGYYVSSTLIDEPLIEASSGGTWTQQSAPLPTGALSGDLSALQCVSSAHCLAVGYYENTANTDVPLAELWDGATWRPLTPTAPGGAIASQLRAVSCVSATSCQTVGNYTTSGDEQLVLAESWNGSSWSVLSAADPGSSEASTLSSLYCSAASTCIAVGDYESTSGLDLTLAEHLSGSSWSIVASAGPGGSVGSQLSGLSCSSGSCTAVGFYITGSGVAETLAEGWNGASWSVEGTPNPAGAQKSFLNAVSCPAPGSCMAVGGDIDSAGANVTLAERYYNPTPPTAWSVESSPDAAGTVVNVLTAVACPAVKDCIAVGYATNSAGENEAVVETWNGTSWTLGRAAFPAHVTHSFLTGVACPTTASCQAVGYYDTTAGAQMLAEVWNGHTWGLEGTMAPAGAIDPVLSSVSCSAEGTCTAVGHALPSAAGAIAPTIVERLSGAAFAAETGATPAGATSLGLAGVSCRAPTACTAVGYFGASRGGETYFPALGEGWNGKSWSLESLAAPPSGTISQLSGISCANSLTCFGVGGAEHASGRSLVDADLVELWNGRIWAAQAADLPSGATSGRLAAVSCVATSSCEAVGYDVTAAGTFAQAQMWNGKAWTNQTLAVPAGATGSSLSGVSCSASTACTAVGSYETSAGVDATLVERFTA